jgi:hypothetical protein
MSAIRDSLVTMPQWHNLIVLPSTRIGQKAQDNDRLGLCRTERNQTLHRQFEIFTWPSEFFKFWSMGMKIAVILISRKV